MVRYDPSSWGHSLRTILNCLKFSLEDLFILPHLLNSLSHLLIPPWIHSYLFYRWNLIQIYLFCCSHHLYSWKEKPKCLVALYYKVIKDSLLNKFLDYKKKILKVALNETENPLCKWFSQILINEYSTWHERTKFNH